MKRFVTVCLLVIVLCTCTVAAATTNRIVYWSGDWRYRFVTDTTVEIAGYVGALTELSLPTQLSGYKVVRIGDFAFEGISHVQKLIIPNSIQDISPYAFSNCSIKTFQISPSNPALEVVDGVIYSKVDKSLIHYPPHLENEDYTIKEGTLVIGTNAFCACNNIVSITLPDTLTTIESAAITWCEKLEEIIIPPEVTDIGDEAFAYNPQLRKITIPSAVNTIGLFAFSGCAADMTIYVVPGTFAEKWANNHGLPYAYAENETDNFSHTSKWNIVSILIESTTLTADQADVEGWIEISETYANVFINGVTIPCSAISVNNGYELNDGSGTMHLLLNEDGTGQIDFSPLGIPLIMLVEPENAVSNSPLGSVAASILSKNQVSIPDSFFSSYEKADFERFNSPASINGLRDTRIYFYCSLDETWILEASGTTSIMGIATDEHGNKWMVHLHVYPLVSKNFFDPYVGKKLVLRGVYQGYSSVYNMPSLVLDEMIVLDTGESVLGMQRILD